MRRKVTIHHSNWDISESERRCFNTYQVNLYSDCPQHMDIGNCCSSKVNKRSSRLGHVAAVKMAP